MDSGVKLRNDKAKVLVLSVITRLDRVIHAPF